jgi:2-hydroxychromene-2-carboxylate isomerase
MNQPPVQFLFDFGSPNAYLCHKVIPSIAWNTNIEFEYTPILLGGLFKLTNNRSPAEAFAGIANKKAYDLLEVRRFVEKHKLHQFRRNPFFPVNTLQIMRGAIAAKRLDCFATYVDAMYSAMWEQGRNMADLSEITDVLKAAGIDAERLLETSGAQDVKNELLANTQSAFERGAFGSPTFFVGEEIYFGKDRLREVEEEMLRLSDRNKEK